MPFEDRIDRERQFLEAERLKKEATEASNNQILDQTELQRLAEIQADSRYHEMLAVANSPELLQAVETFSKTCGYDPDENEDTRGKIVSHQTTYKAQNKPVGSIYLKVDLGAISYITSSSVGEEVYESTSGTKRKFCQITIDWREKPEEKVHQVISAPGGDRHEWTGINAQAGLAIHLAGDEEENIFYDLNTFLNYLASLIASKSDIRKRISVGS